MNCNYLYFILIFIIGEMVMNLTFFRYLKKYFAVEKNDVDDTTNKFLGFDISTFKGLLERFVLFFALSISLSQILIVYGALKIGTRLEKDSKIKNDYFLIGNFSSIFIAIIYYFIYNKVT
jgi:hypothetical protein